MTQHAARQWRASSSLISALMLCAALLIVRITDAAPVSQSVEGYVVMLQKDDIVVDLGRDRGARDGDIVELWRPLKLRHPVTKETLIDRFLIGRLRLTQVRERLALSRPEGKLDRPAEPGDFVVLQRAAPLAAAATPEAETAAPARPTAEPPAEAVEHDVAEVGALLDSLRGAPIARRIRAYDNYVRQRPQSRFSPVFREEAAALRLLLAAGPPAPTRPELRTFSPPARALAGVMLELGVELSENAQGAVLHSRHRGEVAYKSTPMMAAGKGYFLARVPPDRMRPPRLEYFIEAIDQAGVASAVVGNASEPRRMVVEPIPKPSAPARHEEEVRIWTDYADWNRLVGNDRVWQTEGELGFRLADSDLRAVRSGFGVYRGRGGSLEELDELKLRAREVGLTYGYLEGEFGSTRLSFIARGTLGLLDDGIAGGAQALLRIGNDKETNLLIGGELLGGIGLRGITQLELAVFEKVPIMFRTEVTNQPAGVAAQRGEPEPSPESGRSVDTTEVGARAIAQIGYELMPGFVVAGRASYQGRTINHAGPGFGGAVSYSW